MDERLTEDELIRAAARQGCKVSPDQLKRWRRAELISRPVQAHPKGQRGSQATYPTGTLTEALAVCKLREQFKKLERIRFELWWSGQYNGPVAPIRSQLIGELEGLLTELREHRDRFDDPFDAAEAAISQATLDRRHPGIRVMRRLAKNDQDLESVVFAMLLTLLGGEPAWDLKTGDEPSLGELVDRATGIEHAKKDPLLSDEPLLSADASIVEAIEAMFHGGVFNLDDPGWAIRLVSDADLEAARVNARLFLEGLSSVAHIVAARHSRDYAGLGIYGAIDLTDPTLVAITVQWNLLLPSLMTAEEEKAHAAETLDALIDNADKLGCSELFLKELPQYKFLLKPDRDARLALLTYEERELIARTVDDFLKRHPECLE